MGNHVEVTSFLVDKLFVATFFCNNTVSNNSEAVALFNGGKSVGNNEGSATSHDVVKGFLDLLLTVFIESASCLIKEQDVRLTNDCSGNCNTLFLTSRKLRASDSSKDIIPLMELLVSPLYFISLINCAFYSSEGSLVIFKLFEFL